MIKIKSDGNKETKTDPVLFTTHHCLREKLIITKVLSV